MSILQVSHISKTYGHVTALSDISFDVDRGTIFGIIGPDGAGKTTLFRILTTLLTPDSGTASVAGYDILRHFKDIRRSIGYMPGRFSLYPDLTVEENLAFFASVFNTTVTANYRLIEDIYRQIEPFRTRRAGKLSGGMKQKLALCCALIHCPKILFLDEPTTGVDPVSRKEFWLMLRRLKAQGITIIVSTPYMDEASQCDRIALIASGSFLSIDTPDHIIAGYPHRLLSVTLPDKLSALDRLLSTDGIINAYAFGQSIHIATTPDLSPADLMLRCALPDAAPAIITPTVEDCFIELFRNTTPPPDITTAANDSIKQRITTIRNKFLHK